jgi:hypothetical protein
MIAASNLTRIQTVLNEAVEITCTNSEGQPASYIPNIPEIFSCFLVLYLAN